MIERDFPRTEPIAARLMCVTLFFRLGSKIIRDEEKQASLLLRSSSRLRIDLSKPRISKACVRPAVD